MNQLIDLCCTSVYSLLRPQATTW